MKITSTEIRTKLNILWPSLKFIWLTDSIYWMPSKLKLEELLVKSQVDRMRYITSIQDCEDFALQLHADVKRIRTFDAEAGSIPRNEWYPYAFGEIFGYEFRGRRQNHAINICICDDGIYLVEPQDDRIWAASSNNDKPYFIRM